MTAVALVLVVLAVELIQRRQIAHCLNSQLRCNHRHWQAKFLSRLQHRLSVIPTSPPSNTPVETQVPCCSFSLHLETQRDHELFRARDATPWISVYVMN